jgi:hypothetical protein
MKNIYCSLLLGFTLLGTIAQAQYADDNVTIHDNRKAKDPFKAGKKSKNTGKNDRKVYTTISLTDFDLEKKIPEGMDISNILVINAVSDSSLLGPVCT